MTQTTISRTALTLWLPLMLAACSIALFTAPELRHAQSQDPANPEPEQPAEGEGEGDTDEGGDVDVETRVAELVTDLQSDDPEVREAAEKALLDLGPDALPEIEKHMAAATEDPDLRYRLQAIRDSIVEMQGRTAPPTDRDPEELPGMPLPRGFDPDVSMTMQVTDNEGRYTLRERNDGSVIVTVHLNGGDEDTYEFASREEFEDEMPDIAEKFGGLRLFFGDRRPQRDDLEPDGQTNPMPPMPMPRGMNDRLGELLQRFLEGEITQEELMEELERMEEPLDEPMRPDERETTPRDPNEDDPNYVPNPGGNSGMPQADDEPPVEEELARLSVGGVAIEEMPAALRRQLGLTEADGGVIVAEIEDEDGFLAVTDLQQWDVILTVQGLPFSDPATFAEFVGAQAPGTAITLRLYRRSVGEFDITFTR